MLPDAGDPPTVGPYRVLSRLGTHGTVLLGVDGAGARVAIRMVPAAAGHTAAGGRLRAAVRAAAAAPAWFVAPVVAADLDAGRPWIATAFVEGPVLDAYVAAHGPLEAPALQTLAVRTATGLAALHGAGLAHGDLSASTVLLADDGPRLIDPGVTAALGTAGVDPAGDMAAFGALLVHAATGRGPFPAGTPPTDPDIGALTGRLRETARGCLATDPAARPTAAQVVAMLNGETPTVTFPPVDGAAPPGTAPLPVHVPPPVAGWARRSRPALLAAAVVAGVAIALAAAFVLVGGGATSGTAAPQAPSPGAPGSSAPATAPGGVIDPATDPRFTAGRAGFVTPSGNIACLVTAGAARCDVAERSWTVPAAPPDCAGAYGTGAVLEGTRRGELTCATDTVADPALPVLRYGEAVGVGGVTCRSSETGVRCQNAAGHGFQVARSDYELF